MLGEHDLQVWLFGSRRFGTGSTRSDIDLLIVGAGHLKQDLLLRIWDMEPYLDLFEVSQGVATSSVNGSRIVAKNTSDLLAEVKAVCLYRDGRWNDGAEKYRYQQVLAQRIPAATSFPLYELDGIAPAERADIVCLTALPNEHSALVKALSGVEASAADMQFDIADQSGSSWRIRVINVNAMGSVAMAIKAVDVLRRTKASHVVLVGICAGVSGRTNLRDIIIPQSIAYYESAKWDSEGLKSDHKSAALDADVCAKAAAVLPASFSADRVKATDVVMACGEKVVANSEEGDKLRRTLSRKLAAIDMESYGLAEAAKYMQRHPTVIKVVCDLGDEKKDDSVQDEAARIAAAAFRTLVELGGFASHI